MLNITMWVLVIWVEAVHPYGSVTTTVVGEMWAKEHCEQAGQVFVAANAITKYGDRAGKFACLPVKR